MSSVGRTIEADASESLAASKVEDILNSIRALIRDNKTAEALEKHRQGAELFPKSLELKQAHAQTHFLRGEWKKYLAVSTEADQLMQQLARRAVGRRSATALSWQRLDWTTWSYLFA